MLTGQFHYRWSGRKSVKRVRTEQKVLKKLVNKWQKTASELSDNMLMLQGLSRIDILRRCANELEEIYKGPKVKSWRTPELKPIHRLRGRYSRGHYSMGSRNYDHYSNYDFDFGGIGIWSWDC